MKIHIDLPWGGSLDIEREPLDEGKFYAICCVIGGALAVALLLGSAAL